MLSSYLAFISPISSPTHGQARASLPTSHLVRLAPLSPPSVADIHRTGASSATPSTTLRPLRRICFPDSLVHLTGRRDRYTKRHHDPPNQTEWPTRHLPSRPRLNTLSGSFCYVLCI